MEMEGIILGMLGKHQYWQGWCQGLLMSQSTRTLWAGHAGKLEVNRVSNSS